MRRGGARAGPVLTARGADPPPDTCYVLSFAIIMLNTSLHNPNVRDRPPFERFVSMNRGINGGSDLPEEQLRVRGRGPTQQVSRHPGGACLWADDPRGAHLRETSPGGGPPRSITVLRCAKLLQPCLFCDTMDCCQPGSSVQGVDSHKRGWS